MTTEREQILALAKSVWLTKYFISGYGDALEAFYHAARKPLVEENVSLRNELACLKLAYADLEEAADLGTFKQQLAAANARISELEAQGEPVANQCFECWSTNDGDSWYEHPADSELLYEVLGDAPKVGDEFEVLAGWISEPAKYRIVSENDDDFEVECISHQFDNKLYLRAPQAVPEGWEARRMCHGDNAWSNWQPCTDEQAERYAMDETFQVRKAAAPSPEGDKP